MRYAIIGDIHGNSWALRAVLDDLRDQNIDKIFDLGDSLYGPLDPAGTYQLIAEHQIDSICGNQDRLIFENDSLENNRTFTFVRNQLDQTAIDWLWELPSNRRIDHDLFLCHGTPEKDDEYFLEELGAYEVTLKSPRVLTQYLSNIRSRVVCCGHSHRQGNARVGNTLIFNPGSVGLQAYSDDDPVPHRIENINPHARYGIVSIDDDDIHIRYLSVAYDFENAAHQAEKIGRNDWAQWLRFGNV